MYKKYYSEFLEGHGDKIHMAAHSHHFWPNSARLAHNEAYDLARTKSDQKWDRIFSETLPKVQERIATILNFPRPKDISFAGNTHDLLSRFLSSFFFREGKIKILTSKNEFHSAHRQFKRLEEEDKFEITWLDNEASDFEMKLEESLKENEFDIIFFSHVFYNSGYILPTTTIESIVQNKKSAHFVLDAYHGFCAIPTDISKFEKEIYYLAGGYKYAQAGEGMCFMTLPPNCTLRPVVTGWFADYGALADGGASQVNYSPDGFRFWGSTLDMTAFMRFEKVWSEFEKVHLNVEEFDSYIRDLQQEFLENNPFLDQFLYTDLTKLGHFLTLEFENKEKCQFYHDQLLSSGVLTDFRGSRLRFGFSPYLNKDEVLAAKSRLKA